MSIREMENKAQAPKEPKQKQEDAIKAATASRLDSKALKAALLDMAARFITTTTARRFCVN